MKVLQDMLVSVFIGAIYAGILYGVTNPTEVEIVQTGILCYLISFFSLTSKENN